MKLTQKAKAILNERFGKDSVIALATVLDGVPYVRNVNAVYCDGSFYVLTYALSRKIKQIERNSAVAIAGDWFTAQGTAVNLGYWGNAENKDVAARMRAATTAI